MLRLFGIFVFVLVFSITVIPYSYANHDAIPSYVQNNTGWDREIFHKYTLHSFADKFGYVIFPVLENSILKYNSTGETKYNQNILAGSVTLYINASNVNTDLHIAFPNILKYDNSLHVMAPREIPYMVEAFTPTHTHYYSKR